MNSVIVINGVTYHAEKASDPKPWVVIRSRDAGVFFARLVKEENGRVELENSRRIYYWDGAATLSQLAMEGVKKVSNCKFPEELPSQIVLGVCEIIPATEAAVKSIQSVPVWKM